MSRILGTLVGRPVQVKVTVSSSAHLATSSISSMQPNCRGGDTLGQDFTSDTGALSSALSHPLQLEEVALNNRGMAQEAKLNPTQQVLQGAWEPRSLRKFSLHPHWDPHWDPSTIGILRKWAAPLASSGLEDNPSNN